MPPRRTRTGDGLMAEAAHVVMAILGAQQVEPDKEDTDAQDD